MKKFHDEYQNHTHEYKTKNKKQGLENYPGNKIWIYNRWGNLVYKASDYANKWDGVSNVSGIYIGKKVPSGTYFYVLDLNNNTKPIQGYVVLKY